MVKKFDVGEAFNNQRNYYHEYVLTETDTTQLLTSKRNDYKYTLYYHTKVEFSKIHNNRGKFEEEASSLGELEYLTIQNTLYGVEFEFVLKAENVETYLANEFKEIIDEISL